MQPVSIGDLAQGLARRASSARIKADIHRLTQELSTGRVADAAAHMRGDVAPLADIEVSLARLGSYAAAAQEAAVMTAAAQAGLGRIQEAVGAAAADLLTVTPTTLEPVRGHASDRARALMDDVVSALNTNVAGRSLFSGIATDRAALQPAETLVAALRTEVSGLSTASAVLAAVDAWFADPAGFESVVYSGADRSLAPLGTGPGGWVNMSLRADNAAFRQVLRNLAVAALAADPALGFAPDQQNALLQAAGHGLLPAQDDLTGLRAGLGDAEARIEAALARNRAAETALGKTRNTLLAADPYETATRLEEAQRQLEGLFAVTARNARLSLVNFLR